MSPLLIAFGFLALGLVVGVSATVAFYTINGAKMSKVIVERLLDESGYYIQDGKIVPYAEVPEPSAPPRTRPRPFTLPPPIVS